ncbi:MAG: DNA-3-methyladenine glycosylase I [Actinomycetaceae bacterium]|nr:DNA-3-methyladenine glycosylase I [Actinomycetaceae bacterium]MDU0971087.1 DNA-3-methyladenine glycosylase I [Actinomycetaceae bacterium]
MTTVETTDQATCEGEGAGAAPDGSADKRGEDALEVRGLIRGEDGLVRPAWAKNPEIARYYDTEWGRPVTDEQGVFERLCLESLLAGLSWLTILRKRDAFRQVFHGFDPDRVAAMTEDDVERALTNPQILRNRRKIEAVITNARACVAMRDEGGLADFVWSFAPSEHPAPYSGDAVPPSTEGSAQLARELKARGFTFVGPVTTYSLMQAIGVVNDHIVGTHLRPTEDAPLPGPAADQE